MKRRGRGEKFILLALYITHLCFYLPFLSPSPLKLQKSGLLPTQGSHPILLPATSRAVLLWLYSCKQAWLSHNWGSFTVDKLQVIFYDWIREGKNFTNDSLFHKRKHFILARKSENGWFSLKKLSTPLNNYFFVLKLLLRIFF